MKAATDALIAWLKDRAEKASNGTALAEAEIGAAVGDWKRGLTIAVASDPPAPAEVLGQYLVEARIVATFAEGEAAEKQIDDVVDGLLTPATWKRDFRDPKTATAKYPPDYHVVALRGALILPGLREIRLAGAEYDNEGGTPRLAIVAWELEMRIAT